MTLKKRWDSSSHSLTIIYSFHYYCDEPSSSSGGLGSGSGLFFLREREGDCEVGLASGGEIGGGGCGGGLMVGRSSSSSVGERTWDSVGERTWDSETRTAFLRSYFGD